MSIRPEALDAMLAAGCSAEQIVAVVKADAEACAVQGPRSVPVAMRVFVLSRDGYRCTYCGDAGDCADHVVAYSRGGVTEPGNLVAACCPCNASKKDRSLSEWRGRNV